VTSESSNRLGSLELIEDDKIEKQFEDKETKIGQKITEATSKKIIILVLIIMISIPIFNLDTYVIDYNYFQSSIDTLHLLVNQDGFTVDDQLFLENWAYLTSKAELFDAQLVNLRLLENVNGEGENKILKEFGSNSSLDNHRQYEFDGRGNQC